MVQSGDYVEFVELGASTYFRVQQARDQYEKLFKLGREFGKPVQLYIRGRFTDAEGEVESDEWVPVEVRSSHFLWHGQEIRFLPRIGFDFKLGAP